MMDPFGSMYVLIGIGLLLTGVAAAAKIGMWFWFMSSLGRMLHHQNPQYAPASARPSGAPFMKFVSAASTILGLISTCVGLVKECSPEQRDPETQHAGIFNVSQSSDSAPKALGACCTPIGNCSLPAGSPVGQACYCPSFVGPMPGSVCN
jgi:hypothetical protein